MSLNSLREDASNGFWSLASDSDLLIWMKNFSQGFLHRCLDTEKQLDSLSQDYKALTVETNVVMNDFILLSTNQFIENRVYDEDNDDDKTSSSAPPKEYSREEKDSIVIGRYRNSLSTIFKHLHTQEVLVAEQENVPPPITTSLTDDLLSDLDEAVVPLNNEFPVNSQDRSLVEPAASTLADLVSDSDDDVVPPKSTSAAVVIEAPKPVAPTKFADLLSDSDDDVVPPKSTSAAVVIEAPKPVAPTKFADLLSDSDDDVIVPSKPQVQPQVVEPAKPPVPAPSRFADLLSDSDDDVVPPKPTSAPVVEQPKPQEVAQVAKISNILSDSDDDVIVPPQPVGIPVGLPPSNPLPPPAPSKFSDLLSDSDDDVIVPPKPSQAVAIPTSNPPVKPLVQPTPVEPPKPAPSAPSKFADLLSDSEEEFVVPKPVAQVVEPQAPPTVTPVKPVETTVPTTVAVGTTPRRRLPSRFANKGASTPPQGKSPVSQVTEAPVPPVVVEPTPVASSETPKKKPKTKTKKVKSSTGIDLFD
ncbi:hypothetical protein RCL1_004990 [Eukaryota sp. TZLM3-RCL]